MIDQNLRDKLADAYVATIPLVTLNVVWFVLCIPLVTIIPATAALFYATNQFAHGKPADWHTLIEGFKLYFWRSWLWGLLNVAVLVILGSNLIFYSMNSASWSVAAQVMVGAVILIWLSLQMHTFPLIIEQEKPKLLQALRNSFVILVKRPVHTMGTALIVAVLIVGSTAFIQPAWIFITAALCTYLANRVTVSAIARLAGKPAQETLTDPGYTVGE
jgi:uncharacterized membrane protein YesL